MMIKKILAVILVACMCITVVPAYADDNQNELAEQEGAVTEIQGNETEKDTQENEQASETGCRKCEDGRRATGDLCNCYLRDAFKIVWFI